MTPEQLAEEIAKLIAEAEAEFSVSVIKAQNVLYRKFAGILKNLELDTEGYILQNSANRALLRQAENVFDEVIRESIYQSAIEEQLTRIKQIDGLNQKYFEKVDSFFKPNRNFIRSIQQSAIQNVNTYLLNDGLIANVKLPLNQILNQNINTGGSFAGFHDQLRNFIIGTNGKDGKLLRYTRTYLSDALFAYSRAYQEAVTADLDLQWYFYSGDPTSKGKGSGGSRDFCLERMGKYFHRKEVEAWAELEWSGKNPNTTASSIFILLGGYNCKHSMIPVPENVVPADDKQRAIELGYLMQAA